MKFYIGIKFYCWKLFFESFNENQNIKEINLSVLSVGKTD